MLIPPLGALWTNRRARQVGSMTMASVPTSVDVGTNQLHRACRQLISFVLV
jgi:hypothetical protein